MAFDRRARSRRDRGSSSSSPTTIAHCGLPIETCWKAHSRPPLLSVPRAVRPADGKVLGRGRGPPHRHRAGALRGDRRRHRPGGGEDREGVRVGPAVPAQVEDRLAGPVAGELGLGAVRVEDPQLGPDGVVRIELARGRITRTAVPPVDSSGPISFLAGPGSAIVRPLDAVAGYAVPDGIAALDAGRPAGCLRPRAARTGPGTHVDGRAVRRSGAGDAADRLRRAGHSQRPSRCRPSAAGTPRRTAPVT